MRIASGSRRGRRRLGLVAIMVLSAMLGAGSPAGAAEPQVKLSLRPVDTAGVYFDLTMGPGEKRTQAVELANLGDATLNARTYAADVYTIINGGFGAHLRDEARTGTTSWLDYSPSVIPLAPRRPVTRSFTIAVPTDALPGEYLTSILLENDVPLEGTGSVTLNQIVRQALAIVITVPGPRLPGLAIGSASHKVVTGRSTVAVAVENTGNVRLKPLVHFILRDGAGAQVSRTTLSMDTFYAHTATFIEVPLSALLQPGRYTVGLVLEDATADARIENDAIPLQVLVIPPPAAGGITIIPGLTEVIQSIRDGGIPLGVVATLLLVGLVGGLLILVVIRRNRRRLK